MKCGSSGLWEFWGSFAKCVSSPDQTPLGDLGTTCLAPPDDEHGNWVRFQSPHDAVATKTASASSYKMGDKTLLECDLGFVPFTDDGESREEASLMTCGLGGLWEFTGTFAQCVRDSDQDSDQV